MRTYLFFLVLLYQATVLAGSGPCDNATTLICGQLYPGNTLGGTSQFDKSQYINCINDSDSEAYDGNDMVFKLSFTERKVIHIYLHMPTNKDLDMFLFQECDDLGHCLASSFESNRFDNIFTESIEYIVEQGSYFLIVDGKQSNDNGMFTVQVLCECSCIEDLNPLYARSIRCENFDVYDNKPVDHQSNRWSKRFVSGTPAQVRDGYVETLGSEKVLRVKAGPFAGDIYYDLSDLKKDKHRVSWKMFFETGATGVYQLINGEPADGTYADGVYDVYFKAQNRGAVVMNNDTMATFNYVGGDWNDVMQIIDPKNDSIEIWINHQFVFGTKYSAGAAFPYRIKALRFYTITNSNYLIDHICAWEKVAHSIVTCVGDSVCTASGATYKDSCAAEQDFYTSLEYQECIGPDIQNSLTVCDYGGSAIYRSDIFSSTFHLDDEIPGFILTDECVLNAFDGSFPENYRVQIKTFYNDVVQNILPNLSDGNSNLTHLFVYSCVYDSELQKFVQINLAYTSCQFDIDSLRDVGFYYIVIIGPVDSSYTLQIFPDGDCKQNEFQSMNCGDIRIDTFLLDGRFDKSGNGDYERCYNGTRTYTGKDMVYSFDIDEPTFVTIRLNASDQKAIFLYDFLCAINCLTYAEVPPGGDLAEISNYSLGTGRYYIIVDSDTLTNDFFTISLECQPDLVSIPRIFENDVPVCPVDDDSLVVHKLAIPDTASTYLQGGTYMIIGYDDLQNKENVVQSYWPDGETSVEFELPKDATGDQLKCGYVMNDMITVSLFTAYNQENYVYIPCKAVYAEPNGSTVTAKGNFIPTARSYIRKLDKGNQVHFEISPLSRNFSSEAQTAIFTVRTNKLFTIVENPSVDWLTVSFQPDLEFVTVTLTKDSFQIFRETDLQVTLSTNPPLTRSIHISQEAPCITPQVVLHSQNPDNTFCEGETVYLTADLIIGSEDFYSFNWGTGQDTNQISFQAQQTGSFNVDVVEKKCYVNDSASINITVIDAPDVEAGADVTICPGDSVTLNAVATPGAHYLWNTGQATSSIIVHPDTVTKYKVTVTVQGAQCMGMDSVTVFTNPVAEWSIHIDSMIHCKGDATGQLSVSSDNSSQPQAVLWSNNVSTEINSNLPAGTYSVSITDGFGCVHLDTFELTEPDHLINFSIHPDSLISCKGDNSGQLNLVSDDGSEPQSVLWSNGVTTSLNTNLFAGLYSVIVSDQFGCEHTETFELTEPDEEIKFSDTIIVNPINGNDGQIQVTVSGGISPYTFTWINSSNDTVSHDAVLTGQSAGCYTLVVVDAAGCIAQVGCIGLITSTIWLGDHSLQIYPNPSDGKIFIKCKQPTVNQVNWEILDILGRTIKKGAWSDSQEINEVIDLAGNGSGYYLLTLDSGQYKAMEIIILY